MSNDTRTLNLRNARLVLEDSVVEGDLAMVAGRIGEQPLADAPDLDFGGDYLLPGLIDLHTDNLEHHLQPRPAVIWPSAIAAVLAHDTQVLGSGITTVLDALSLGDYDSKGSRTRMLVAAIEGITSARQGGLLKADHYFHFRCELSDGGLPPLVEQHIDNAFLRLLSMMDHTPGQRQWHDVALYREFRRKKNNNVWTDVEFEAYIAERREHQDRHVPGARELVARLGAEYQLEIASHDDTSAEDVAQAIADGISISEFPTTRLAAEHARAGGMKIVMGAPNVVLGGSHSGNVSALELARAGLLDILTSDYVPASLLHAAFLLSDGPMDLPAAVATVTANPAAVLGFADRGRIAPGLRADLLRVRVIDGLPVIRGLWVEGRGYF